MAFSIRKMLSNITYFTKPEDEGEASDEHPPDIVEDAYRPSTSQTGELSDFSNYQHTEPDSTSRNPATVNMTDSTKEIFVQVGSLSDTDVQSFGVDKARKEKKRHKLKLDVKKANKSTEEAVSESDKSSDNVENTPKHILLACQSSENFTERMQTFDFVKKLDLLDALSDEHSSFETEALEVDSLSDSESDISFINPEDVNKSTIKMCRKVNEESCEDSDSLRPPTADSDHFNKVDIDKNEEARVNTLFNYQMKLEKMEYVLKRMLTDFQFRIEVSNIFNGKSVITAQPGTDVNNLPKKLGKVSYIDNIDRGVSPTGSWNIILEKEDDDNKIKLKGQLLSMKSSIDKFVNNFLKNQELCKNQDKTRKKPKINNKKKMKCFDFPDLRAAMVTLFEEETAKEVTKNEITNLSDCDESDLSKCVCRCHAHNDTDSGLTSKSTDHSTSITSSLGNFSLDSTTLSAYSESLQQNLSYNSYQDTSLLSTLLQKAAIERITFYVQVHSIQLKCESNDQEYESKNTILFHCPCCLITETEEDGLLKHILSQRHCEKIHFSYKTAYIKKCVEAGKEIQPSTVLNPMRMYRDDNKIVCFGDAMYACSLCFENLIIGESILMAHCSDPEHVERREKMDELLE